MYSNVTERQTTNVVTEDPAKSLVPNAICGLENTVAVEEDDNNHAVSPLQFECMEHTSKAGLTKNQINHQKIDCQDELPSSSPDTEVPKPDIDFTFDGISGATLQTFIVGRRFSDEKEINLETSISLLRDPQNPKDPYAIKVHFHMYLNLNLFLKYVYFHPKVNARSIRGRYFVQILEAVKFLGIFLKSYLNICLL